MRLLFASYQSPLPLDNGGRLRSYHLIEELARRARVWLVCHDRHPGSTQPATSAAALEGALPAVERVVTVAAPRRRRRPTQLAAVVTRRSSALMMSRSSALAGAVRSASLELRPDLVHCDSLFSAYLHREAPEGAVRVLGMHNSESLLMRRLAETADGRARRLLYRSEARALDRHEGRHLAAFDHCLAVSEREAELFRRISPSVVTIPNGVDPAPVPSPPARLAAGEPLRLLFVGSLNYEPNRMGLAWFLESVAPLVRARLAMRIQVVGRGTPRLAFPPDVDYVGPVEDLQPVYSGAHAAVVPLHAGAGSRLKVLEALAHGVPLVSTSLGVEGFDLVDGQEALVADRPEAMADRIAALDTSLRGDTRLAASLQATGYAYVQRFFWPRIGDRLMQVYEGWVARGRPPESPASGRKTVASRQA